MGAVSKLEPRVSSPPSGAVARSSGIRQRTRARAQRGDLGRTPLVELLTTALDTQQNGTLCLTEADGTKHAVHLHRGIPAKVRTGVRVAPLDAAFRLMGYDLDHVFARTIDEATNGTKLHGELLVREGHIDEATLYRALRAQVMLKMCYLLRLGGRTRFTITLDTNVLDDHGGPELTPTQPLALIAQGCRLRKDDGRARARVGRITGQRLQLHPYANVDAMQLRPKELAVVNALRDHPCSMETLLATRAADEETTFMVVSLLLLTRSLDLEGDPPVGRGLVKIPPVIRRRSSAASMRAVVVEAASKSAVVTRMPTEREIDARVASVGSESPFATLGVSENATEAAIESAYMKAMFQWHPDRLPRHLKHRRKSVERICSAINLAHATLRDPMKRSAIAASVSDRESVESAASASELYERARVQLRKRDLEAAEELLTTALENDDKLLSATALRAWVQAERLGPHPDLERGQTSDVYRRQLKALDAVLAEDPKYIEGRYYRGQLLKRSGYVAEALRDFKIVLDLNPRHVDAKRELRLHHMREDKRRAKKGIFRRMVSRPTPAWPMRPKC